MVNANGSCTRRAFLSAGAASAAVPALSFAGSAVAGEAGADRVVTPPAGKRIPSPASSG